MTRPDRATRFTTYDLVPIASSADLGIRRCRAISADIFVTKRSCLD